MQKAINDQINAELHSAHLYFFMASYFKSLNLDGFAQWMTVQAQEEISHATKFFNFVLDRGAKALLQPIAGPDTEWDSPLAAFEAAGIIGEKKRQDLSQRARRTRRGGTDIADRGLRIADSLDWAPVGEIVTGTVADAIRCPGDCYLPAGR